MSKFPQKNIDCDSYAVIGDPISQSLSPQIHRLFAKQVEAKITYDRWHLNKASFSEAVKGFFAQGGGGLNITAPHKQLAYQLSTKLSDRAKLAGAVNTLFLKDNEIVGDTTDGLGLLQDLERLSWKLRDKRVLILGAGGAVRGVLQPLIMAKPAKITIANRTLEKAEALQEIFSDLAANNQVELKCSAIENLYLAFDLVINATSASLSNNKLNLAASVVQKAKCYDMVYGAEQTAFMQWSLENGAEQVADGLGMLVGQAAEAFNIWRGVKPETSAIIKILRQDLIVGR